MTKTNNNKAARGKNAKSGNVNLTPEEARTVLAKQLGIKPKTKEFVDLMQADSKLSATEAYIRTHQTESRATARANASKLQAKASVQIYSDSIVKKAKTRIGSLVQSPNESIALKASQDVIDRTEGKAIQKTENSTKVVHVSLDLSGLRLGAHYVKAEQLADSTQ